MLGWRRENKQRQNQDVWNDCVSILRYLIKLSTSTKWEVFIMYQPCRDKCPWHWLQPQHMPHLSDEYTTKSSLLCWKCTREWKRLPVVTQKCALKTTTNHITIWNNSSETSLMFAKNKLQQTSVWAEQLQTDLEWLNSRGMRKNWFAETETRSQNLNDAEPSLCGNKGNLPKGIVI